MQNYGAIPPSAALGASPSASPCARLFFSAGGALVDAASATSGPKRLEFSDLLPLEPQDTVVASLRGLTAAHFPFDDLSPRGALRGLWRAHGTTVLWCVAGHAFTAAASILAPLIVQQVVLAFSDDQVDASALRVWLALFFTARVLAVLVDTHVFLTLNHVVLRLMAALRSVLFRKALRTQLHATNAAGLDVSTLATSDASCCLAAVHSLAKLVVVPIHILVTTYLLHTVLGVAAFPGIVVIALSLTANYRIARVMSAAYGKMMTLKDARMRSVHEAFGAMQHVKLNGWESWFETNLAQQRGRELSELRHYVYAAAASAFVLWGSPLAVSTVSFAWYALVLGQELTAAKVFTAAVLFNVLRGPLQDAPTIVQSLLQSCVSLERIRRYMESDERDPTSVNHVDVSSADEDTNAIAIHDASFAWHANAPLAVRGLTLDARHGDLVLVTGDVGAGKTALCLALLGELQRRSASGVPTVAGAIAYVSQTPWIQHGSLRDNILFGRAWDPTRYHEVIHACCLEEDFALLPAGDLTEIGERGVNLSGGQKMRLALARACYADADVYVLDAPLAPIDGPVQLLLIERCICTFLSSKTVVLTCHHPHERLVALDVVNIHVHLQDSRATTTTRGDAMSRPAVLQQQRETPVTTRRDPSVRTAKQTVGRLVVDEARERGDVAVGVWTRYFHAVGGTRVLLALAVTQLLWQLCQISGDVWLGFATGHSLASSRIVAVYALLTLATATMVALRGLVVSHMGLRASKTLFQSMVHGLLHAPLRFFDTTPIGRVLNRFVDDVLVLDRSIPTSLGLFLGVASATAGALLTAAVGIGLAGVLLLPLTALYVVIAKRCVRAFCELMRLRKIGLAPILSHLAQSQRGAATLRAFGGADVDRAVRAFESRVDDNSTLWHSEIVLNQWFIQRLQFLGCGVLAVVLGAVYVGAPRGQFSAGTAGLVLTYALSVNSALTTLVRAWARSENAMVSVERVLAYSDLAPEGVTHAQGDVTDPWPSQGRLKFDHVRFAYANDVSVGDDLVLRDVSFSVRGGESVGVIGRTGAGKSSLVMALFRINNLVGGHIRIDGVDIATVPLPRLRDALAIIAQSPVLLEGSVRAFLDPRGTHSDAALLKVLDDVKLTAALGALMKTGGIHGSGSILDLALRAEGDNLSVGQRQLLCLARVLLRKARIVVLDEATASVDPATERCLTETLARELGGATRLTIAHRLETVLHADKLLVLDHGRVAAFDTPHELLATGGDTAALLRAAQQPKGSDST